MTTRSQPCSATRITSNHRASRILRRLLQPQIFPFVLSGFHGRVLCARERERALVSPPSRLNSSDSPSSPSRVARLVAQSHRLPPQRRPPVEPSQSSAAPLRARVVVRGTIVSRSSSEESNPPARSTRNRIARAPSSGSRSRAHSSSITSNARQSSLGRESSAIASRDGVRARVGGRRRRLAARRANDSLHVSFADTASLGIFARRS